MNLRQRFVNSSKLIRSRTINFLLDGVQDDSRAGRFQDSGSVIPRNVWKLAQKFVKRITCL